MNKRMKWTVLAGLVAVAAFAPVAQAGIALPDPGVVGPYRLAFVTSVRPGSSDPTDMASLNAWVTSLAEAVTELDALGTTWSVIGATTAVDVFTNTSAEPGVDPDTPVYLVNGTLFAADLTTFWSNGITIDPSGPAGGGTLWITEEGEGASNGATWVQTGLTTDGVSPLPITAVGHELDGNPIRHGGLDIGYNNATYPWYAGNSNGGDDWGGNFGQSGLFAISGVISGGQTPLLITGTSYAGPGHDFIIDFTGKEDTTYNVESSADLQDPFLPIAGVTATTNESGGGTATIPAAEVGSGRNFFRIAKIPE